MNKKILILTLILSFLSTTILNAAQLDKIIKNRLNEVKITQTIMGILICLDDNQVRNRPGRRISIFDASDLGEGCRGRINLNLPFLQKPLHLPSIGPITIRNVSGEWLSTVHFLPKKLGKHSGKSLITIPDSNLFVPSFVAYPMFLFREDSNIKKENRLVSNMLKDMWNMDKRYKRGKEYNFWLPLPDKPYATGPYNMPVDKTVLPLAKAYINPKLSWFWKKFVGNLNVPTPSWVKDCLDPKNNPSGASALFNIPNDSDDTSTALALQKIKQQLQNYYKDDDFFSNPENFEINNEALQTILKYRDINREPQYEDGRDEWKGRNSGAFLTWLRDEKEPTFSHPERGIIPLGKNNVDSVVNSNVMLALGLLNKKNVPGYKEAVILLEKAVEKRVWPASGLYYPQFLIFPYTVSRAYRDGGVSELKPAMRILLKDLLKIQKNYGLKHSYYYGAFPGGEDKSVYTSTALGVTSLLNIGIEIAKEEGIEVEYKNAIKAGIEFLINKRRIYKVKNPETLNAKKDGRKVHGYWWDSGLFFSASFWDLAHWRSEAFCSAMVLEALSKYLLAYEYGGVTINKGRRLKIVKYPFDMSHNRIDYKLIVK